MRQGRRTHKQQNHSCLDANLRAKEGGVGGGGGWATRKRGRRRFASRLSPSHSPLRFALATARKTENAAPEKEEAGLRKYLELCLGNLYVDIGA